MKRFIVTQIGARRNYAVPSILEKAGMLEAFYTDIVGNAGVGKIVPKGKSLPIIGDRLKLLAGRQVPPEILPHTHTFARLLHFPNYAMMVSMQVINRLHLLDIMCSYI